MISAQFCSQFFFFVLPDLKGLLASQLKMGQNLSLLRLAALDMGIQWTLFAIACYLQTEKFYDVAGTSTFGLLVIMSLKKWDLSLLSQRQKIQTCLVLTWCARLGTFLFGRVIRAGDSRFDKVKINPRRFFLYWTVQGDWTLFSTA